VEDALAKAGAEPGCTVRIGNHEFDWQPTANAFEEYVPGRRGTDHRLDENNRIGAAERKAARQARRQRPDNESETPE
jgi:GTP-binding protein